MYENMSTCGDNSEGRPSTSSVRKRKRAKIDHCEWPIETTSNKGPTLEKEDIYTARITRGKILWEEVSINISVKLGEQYIDSTHPADGLRFIVQAWTTADVNTYKFLVFLYMQDILIRKYDFPHIVRWQVGVVQEGLDENCPWTEIRDVNIRKKCAGWRFVDLLEFKFEMSLLNSEKPHQTSVRLKLSLRLMLQTPPTAAEQAIALQRKLNELYLSSKEWDVTINVRDSTFRAHASILGERAPALAALLCPLKTPRPIINIEDCEPNAFAIFLLYLYSGTVENLTRDNILEVYFIAVKYGLHRLKAECFRYTMCNLSLDSVLRVLAFGLNYHETLLAATAFNFYLENALQVLGRDEWHRFEAENGFLAAELRNITLKCYRSSG